MTFDFPQNDLKMAAHVTAKAVEIGKAMGAYKKKQVAGSPRKGPYTTTQYQTTHNTGGTVMGSDPSTSVVNRYLQSWDVPNVFVIGGFGVPAVTPRGIRPIRWGLSRTGPSTPSRTNTSKIPAAWCPHDEATSGLHPVATRHEPRARPRGADHARDPWGRSSGADRPRIGEGLPGVPWRARRRQCARRHPAAGGTVARVPAQATGGLCERRSGEPGHEELRKTLDARRHRGSRGILLDRRRAARGDHIDGEHGRARFGPSIGSTRLGGQTSASLCQLPWP